MTPQAATKPAQRPGTPPLPFAEPGELGLSPARLQRMRAALQREIDKGTTPGVVTMIARGGRIGWFEAQGRLDGRADATGAAPMTRDSLFRIFSMTKPLVSLAIAMLLEDGLLLLGDPIEKFIPEFADQKVGIEADGKLALVPRQRSITIHDLLRHTSGLSYEITGDGLVQRMYRDAKVRRRDISNAEHARMVAALPLMCQPGSEWNYSRSTDVLGRVIEVISGKPLGVFLTEHILAPLRMSETAFSVDASERPRIAEAFPSDPWTGERVVLFDPVEKPVMESGGGGLVSTAMDYARFCQMLLNGGKLDGVSIIARKTLQFMAADHLAPHVKVESHLIPPGHSFGLGFAVRTHQGMAPYAGSVGQYFWSGMAGTFFWIDPAEDLFALFMSQGPGQREYFRSQIRSLVYAALV